MFLASNHHSNAEIQRLKKEMRTKKPSEVLEILWETLAKLKAENAALHDKVALIEDFVKSRDLLINKSDENYHKTSNNLPSDLEIHATWNLGFENCLYQLEYDSNGVPYRWSGPSNLFGFDILIDRSQDKIGKLELLYAVDNRNFSEITVFLDGQKIDMSIISINDTFYGEFKLPARMWSGLTYVRFCVPIQKSPENNTLDQRMLGVAFHKLSII